MDNSKTDSVRLNKFLAHSHGMSRRTADEMIANGRVSINGVTARMGSQVRPDDVVALDGKQLTAQTDYTYVMFHKPVGYVCSRRQQGPNPTIYELLPKNYQKLKAVGRLDADSSGLLLLTDDGDFAHRMTHPSHKKQKTYQIELDRDLAELHQQMISDIGVSLEDGVSKLSLERMSDNSRKAWTVSMHEGRNRQIRRTFLALGYNVIKLHRTQFGPYSLGNLKPGHPEKTSVK